jgi:hypothetical protein
MFLLQARQGGAELAFFLFGHRRDVLCTGRGAVRPADVEAARVSRFSRLSFKVVVSGGRILH